MSAVYVIAFAGKPKANFLPALQQYARDDGVEFEALTLTGGPGCSNLGLMLAEPNEVFVNALTMALMPAKWSHSSENDPMIERGAFKDLINGGHDS